MDWTTVELGVGITWCRNSVRTSTCFRSHISNRRISGNVKYQVKDFSYSIMEVNAENEVPIHRRLMSLVPGMGAGFATNLVVGSLAGVFGFGLPLFIPIAVGLGIAAKSHSDTVRDLK